MHKATVVPAMVQFTNTGQTIMHTVAMHPTPLTELTELRSNNDSCNQPSIK